MLKIVFGENEKALYGPVWFQYNYEITWFHDELVQKMIESVDKSRYIDGEYIESEVLGPISPLNLSGGLKTLISIYENPELVFDATSCGGNYAKWLIEMGKDKDITINLKYIMRFRDHQPFEIFIVNENRYVRTNEEYVDLAIKYI